MKNFNKRKIQNVFQVLNLKKVIIPLIISLTITGFLIYKDKNFKLEHFSLIKDAKIIYVIGSFLVLFLRDFLYILRIRLLVNKKLSWASCFIIIILWEFSSAVTPSAIGGGFVAVFLFLKEGISLGEAIAYVLVTATFDNYFFLISVPFSYFLMPDSYSFFDNGLLTTTFIGSYCLIFLYASFMSCALFIKPEFFKFIMVKVTSIKFLNRFKNKAIEQGDELIHSSQILKKHSSKFWLLILFITLITWTSRYVILNFIVAAFVDFPFIEHINILCKHLILWITMLVSPTPGGSGIVEICFNSIYKDSFGLYTFIISIIWRFLTYYVYLLLGFLILPSWIRSYKQKCIKNKKNKNEEF